jgi:hypothetical protein
MVWAAQMRLITALVIVHRLVAQLWHHRVRRACPTRRPCNQPCSCTAPSSRRRPLCGPGACHLRRGFVLNHMHTCSSGPLTSLLLVSGLQQQGAAVAGRQGAGHTDWRQVRCWHSVQSQVPCSSCLMAGRGAAAQRWWRAMESFQPGSARPNRRNGRGPGSAADAAVAAAACCCSAV